MKTTVEARRLTEAYRLDQVHFSARVVDAVNALWRRVDLRSVDATWPEVAHLLATLVAAGYFDRVGTAAAYLEAHGSLFGVNVDPSAPPDLPAAQVETSLRVTGPVAFKKATLTAPSLEVASARARNQLVGATQRLTLKGGRSTIVETARRSPNVAGWQRVSSGATCAFCAMLVSRGPVYGPGADFAAHDHCFCTAEPVYDLDAELSDQAQHYRDLWKKAAKDTDPDGSVLATLRKTI